MAPFTKPGFLIRRLQQVSVRVFQDAVGKFDISPVQYGALEVIRDRRGIDQTSLSQAADVDRTTVVRVVDRLQGMGLLLKKVNRADRRSNQLYISAAGEQLLRDAHVHAENSQRQLLSPLTPAEQTTFLALATKLVLAHTEKDSQSVGVHDAREYPMAAEG